jgi:endonuclease YncB( thermonuclease family)
MIPPLTHPDLTALAIIRHDKSEPCPQVNHAYKATVVSVYDGDSIVVNVPMEHRSGLMTLPVRLHGVYAAEMQSGADGEAARSNLSMLLKDGRCVLQFTGAETFGRPVVKCWNATQDVCHAQIQWLKTHSKEGGVGV